jgi:hypothetical protein
MARARMTSAPTSPGLSAPGGGEEQKMGVFNDVRVLFEM